MPSSYDLRPVQITHDPNQRIDTSAGKLPEVNLTALLQQAIDFFEQFGIEAIKQVTGIDLTGIVQLLDTIGINLEIPDFRQALLDLLTNVSNIINALQGIDLSSPGAVVDSVQAVVNAFIVSLLSLIGDVIPVVGSPLEQLGLILLATVNNGIDALQGVGTVTNQVGDLASKIDFNPTLPAWQSYANGDQSVQFSTCLNSTTITPTVARWGFMRITNPAEKRSISVFCQKSASGVTGIFFDVYRINPDGSAVWVYTSANEVTNASSVSLSPLAHTIPAASAIVVGAGDLYAVQMRMTGSTSVTVLSNNNTPDTTAGNLLPKRLGGARDPSTTAAPATLTSGAMDAIYNAITAYLEFDIVLPAPSAVTIFDDFQDINLSTAQFTNYRTTVFTFFGQAIYLTVENGCAAYAGGTDGFQGALTLSRLNMPTNSCRLGVQVSGLSSTTAWAAMNCASDWSSGVMLGVTTTGVQIATFTSFNDAGTVRASGSYSATVGDGSWVYMQYDGPTNTYSVFDDAGTICTWTDGGSVVPHGVTNQYGAIKLVQASGIKSAKFDAFKLWDTDAAIPAPSAPPSSGGGGTPVIGATFPLTFGFILGGPADQFGSTMKPPVTSMTGVSSMLALNSTMKPAVTAMTGDVPTTGMSAATMKPPVTSMAGIASTLTDPFNDLSNWSVSGTSAALATSSSGHLSLAGPTSGYVTLLSNVTYDMTGKSVQIETVSSGSGNHEDHLRLTNAGGSAWNSWIVYYGTLYAQAGGSNLNSVVFNAVTHKFLRLRQDTGGTVVYYDYSADGVSWTNFASGGTLYPLTAAYVQILYTANAGVTTTYDNLIIS